MRSFRRLGGMLLSVAVSLTLVLGVAPASADPPSGGDDGGTDISVGAGGGGSSSNGDPGEVDTGITLDPPDSNGSTGGGSSGHDADPGTDTGVSQDDSGWSKGQDSCIDQQLVEPQPPADDPRWEGAAPTTHQLYQMQCIWAFELGDAGTPVYQTTYVVSATGTPPAAAPPDPAVLAQQAYASMKTTIPAPKPTTSPDFRMAVDPTIGQAVTVVNLWVWFWATPDVWHPITQTLTLRGVRVTVTATPTTLTYTPGNGDDPVVCGNAPGVPWREPADRVSNPDPNSRDIGGCGYRYERVNTVSTPWTATVAITWQVTWTSNIGRNGALDPLTTRVNTAPFVVEQIDVVLGGN